MAANKIAADIAINRASSKVEDAVKNNFISDYWKDVRHDNKARCLYITGAVFFAIFLGICFSQLLFFTRESSRPRDSFVIFTDGDVDDLLALNYLFRRSDAAVPLIVVSGNGLASPFAAYKNVRNFVSAVAQLSGNSRVASNTRVVLGASLSKRDASQAYFKQRTEQQQQESSSSSSSNSEFCSYSRFARASLAVTTAADTLYGQSAALAKLARRNLEKSPTSYESAKQYDMFEEFGKVLNGAIQTGTKVTLISMSPLTDMSSLLDSLPTSTITDSIKLLVVSGGRFDTSTRSGISDAGLFTRDLSRKGSFGSYSELNFFLDPESAENVLSPNSRYTSTLLPTIIIPLDVSGSNSAYTDFHDQWVKLSMSPPNSENTDPLSNFLTKTVRAFSSFEGSTFFPYKGTPKSIAAVAVALDRRVRNQLYVMKEYVGVMTWEKAQTLNLAAYVGRTGKVSEPIATATAGSPVSTTTTSSSGAGKPDIIVGISDSSSSTASNSNNNNGVPSMTSSRLFLDSYFSMLELPWPR